MKKFAFAALAATALVSSPAMANSGTTTIGATIDPVCALQQPADTGVSLGVGSSTPLASPLYIICNAAGGFTFSLDSGNDFQLIARNSTTAYNYSLSSPMFPGEVATADLGPVSVPGAANWVAGQNIPISVNIVSATGPAYAGTYLDELTFTITAN